MGEKSRLLWRCRRGVKEMDLLLECFLERCYPVLDSDERQAFEAFLEEPDPEILDWIMGRGEPDNPAYRKIVEQLRQLSAAPPPADG